MSRAKKGRIVTILALLVLLPAGWWLWATLFPSPLRRLTAEIAGLPPGTRVHPIGSLRPGEFSYLCILGPYQSGARAESPYGDLLADALSTVRGSLDDGLITLVLIRPHTGTSAAGKPTFAVTYGFISRASGFDLAHPDGRDGETMPPDGFTAMDCAAADRAALLRLEPDADGQQRYLFGERTVGE